MGDRMTALVGQLEQNPYQSIAAELIRYRAEANDDVVAGIVRSVVADGEDGGDLFRHALDDDALDTLRLFTISRALLGRRLSSLGPLYEALDACALLPGERDVPWETWVKAALFIARDIGGDLDSYGASIRRSAPRGGAPLLRRTRIDGSRHELSQCHIAEVSTTYGVGFIETLAFQGRPTRGLGGSPRQADNYVAYEPTTNLAQLCASLADALDSSKKVVIGPIGQDQLAATLFSQTDAGVLLATAGCLSFVAEDVTGSSLTAFVAELPGDEDDPRRWPSRPSAASENRGRGVPRVSAYRAQPSAQFRCEIDVTSTSPSSRTSSVRRSWSRRRANSPRERAEGCTRRRASLYQRAVLVVRVFDEAGARMRGRKPPRRRIPFPTPRPGSSDRCRSARRSGEDRRARRTLSTVRSTFSPLWCTSW